MAEEEWDFIDGLEEHQVVLRLYDLPALLLRLQPACHTLLTTVVFSVAKSSRGTPHQEVFQLYGPRGGGGNGWCQVT